MNGLSWRDAIPLIKAVYDRPNGFAGCCLHVLIDDGNCEQEFADLALERAREIGHVECIVAAEMLQRMSLTQRKKLAKQRPWIERNT